MFDDGDPVTRRPTVVVAAVGLFAVSYLVAFAVKLSSGWVGREAVKNRLRHPDQSANTAHGIAVAAVVISVGLMCAVLVLALATWRGSRAAEFAACAIVLLVSVLTVVAASRRSSSIGEWASVAIDLAVLAVIGIGLRIYHRGPT